MLDEWVSLPGSNASFLLTSARHSFEGCVAACAEQHENASLACIDSAAKAVFVGKQLVGSSVFVWFGLFQHPVELRSRAGWQPTVEVCELATRGVSLRGSQSGVA